MCSMSGIDALPEGDPRRPLAAALAHHAAAHPANAEAALQVLDFVLTTPDCFERSHLAGHITGSAWLLDPTGRRALMTLHHKLQRWLQPGGHADGDPDTLRVALREATEESGIGGIVPLDREIFDVDVHLIPARGEVPAHYHYDVRYLLRAPHADFCVSAESDALAWLSPGEIAAHRPDASVQRLCALWQARMPG